MGLKDGILLQVLEELNKKREGPKLEVVLFDSALEHLSRLHRVLRMRRGHTVLVGSPGSGRKSLFSLAASAAQCQPFRLPFSAKLVPQVVRDIYRFIGVEKKSAALYVIDADIKQQGLFTKIYYIRSYLINSKKYFYLEEFLEYKCKNLFLLH